MSYAKTPNHITKGSENQGSTRGGNPQPHHQRVQKPRFHKGGGEPDAQTQEEGNPNDMSHLQRTSSGQHSHAVT